MLRRSVPVVLLIAAAAVFVAVMSNEPTAAAADPAAGARVLRHVVMYKFRDDCTPQQVQQVVDAFAGLPSKIDTIAGFERGTNVSKEGKSDGLTHCFVVTFRDEHGLATYLKHPAHDEYVKVVRDKREKVVVFDYWAEAKR